MFPQIQRSQGLFLPGTTRRPVRPSFTEPNLIIKCSHACYTDFDNQNTNFPDPVSSFSAKSLRVDATFGNRKRIYLFLDEPIEIPALATVALILSGNLSLQAGTFDFFMPEGALSASLQVNAECNFVTDFNGLIQTTLKWNNQSGLALVAPTYEEPVFANCHFTTSDATVVYPMNAQGAAQVFKLSNPGAAIIVYGFEIAPQFQIIQDVTVPSATDNAQFTLSSTQVVGTSSPPYAELLFPW